MAIQKKRRPSAVSQVIKSISTQTYIGNLEKYLNTEEDFNFIVATNSKTRRKAYELAYNVYHQSGYVDNEMGLYLSDYDGHSNIFTLLVESKNGDAVGTITLNFEMDCDLPCDEIFFNELNVLRKVNKRLVEITRLAIAPDYRYSKTILLKMFNFIYIHAFHNMKQTDFVIEVHPKHERFYTKKFGFQKIGEAKPCERVKGSPGVLLSLPLKYWSNQLKDIRSSEKVSRGEDVKFANVFYGEEAESEIKDFLKGKNSEWTSEEFEMYRSKELCLF